MDALGLGSGLLCLLFAVAFGWGRRRGRREGVEEGLRSAPLELRREGLEQGTCVLCGRDADATTDEKTDPAARGEANALDMDEQSPL